MAGFDKAKIDEIFYENTSWESNFLMNLGYGDVSTLYPRGYRLSFDEGCAVV